MPISWCRFFIMVILFTFWYAFGMADTGCSFLCVMLLSEALVKQAWWWWNLWVLACSQKILFFLHFWCLVWLDMKFSVESCFLWGCWSHSLLACKVSAERSAVSLIGFPLWVTWPFSLAALSIFSFISTLANLTLCALGLLFLRHIFAVFSVLPGIEYYPVLLGWESFPG